MTTDALDIIAAAVLVLAGFFGLALLVARDPQRRRTTSQLDAVGEREEAQR